MKISDLLMMTCLTVLFAGGACHQTVEKDETVITIEGDSLPSYLEHTNKALNEHEEKLINQYIKRHEWNLEKSATGLRYKVYCYGKGPLAKKGDLVRINYKIELINGILAYSSRDDGPQEVLIERSDFVSGLHEMLQLMNTGAKVKAIIPSYLAYGFTGDQERIPKGATLIYDIEVIEIVPYK